MAIITGSIEFYTSPSMTAHDLKVCIGQNFEIVRGVDGPELEEMGAPLVDVFAGDMQLWEGEPKEMTGWLKPMVEARIKAGEWEGISAKDIREAIAEEREVRAFAREHAAGVL